MEKSVKEIVLEAEKAGDIVFMTCDGLMRTKLDKFISQPTEELLYDLNRDRTTVLSWLDAPKVGELWINNFAAMLVITKLKEGFTNKPINIIFDGPPSHGSGRFVEIETDDGESINIGEWVEREDGLWALRIDILPKEK